MSGNTVFRFANSSVLAVASVDANRVVTSEDIDDQLAATYERLGLRPGLLGGVAGIRERRWWDDGVTYVDGAAMAGAKALAQSGTDPADVGLMINTSVSRAHLEPSTAVAVHHALGLPRSCQNFDVTNACLGFVNGMELAAAMIDSGQIDYALVVNGEDSQAVQEATLARLCGPDSTAADVMGNFATLTLGSGAVAMVLGQLEPRVEEPLEVGSHHVVVPDAQVVVLGRRPAHRPDETVPLRVPVGATQDHGDGTGAQRQRRELREDVL